MKPALVSLIIIALLLAMGCRAAAPPPAPLVSNHIEDVGLTTPSYLDTVDAVVTPPLGWSPDPLKSSDTHKHQVWLSPTGRTAYGVIHFSMPLPVGHELALWGFLREMRRSEGESQLLSKRWDSNSGFLRFVAQGGLYVVRTNLFVSGRQGWACYAGTLKNEPIEQDELALAEVAREHTAFGRQLANANGAGSAGGDRTGTEEVTGNLSR